MSSAILEQFNENLNGAHIIASAIMERCMKHPIVNFIYDNGQGNKIDTMVFLKCLGLCKVGFKNINALTRLRSRLKAKRINQPSCIRNSRRKEGRTEENPAHCASCMNN